MKGIKIGLLAAAAALAGMACLAAAILGSRSPVTILMYHHLVPDGSETNSLTVTESKFRQDMEYLQANGYQTLLPDELEDILRRHRKCPEKAVVVSFDDGYRSNYEIAYPILCETGCRAVISLITANMQEEAKDGNFMLSWPEIEEMSASGMVAFGSHTDNLHNPDIGGELRTGRGAVNGVQRLRSETRAAYRERVGADLARSFALIEAHTGKPVSWFAYPYGAGDRWCEQLLSEMDVAVSVSTEPGYAWTGGGTRDLPRYAVREDTDLSTLLPG